MKSAEFCIYQDRKISVEEALQLRSKYNISSRDNFRCVECGQPVRAHKASKTTNHPAHFEHFERNPRCPYSDVYEPDPGEMISHPILDEYDSARITSFWGWSPETWGCVGFTESGRRDTIIDETSDPFIMVIYVTKNAGEPRGEIDLRGYVAGFYEMTHEMVDRDEYTDKQHHSTEPQKWRHSLRAKRAFEIIPEDRPHITALEPSIYDERRAQAVAAHSSVLSNNALKKLKTYSYREIPVFRSQDYPSSGLISPSSKRSNLKGYVLGGNVNGSGYYVPPEPDGEKELYILCLQGNTEAFLGEPAGGREIYKVGLSISPMTRVKFFNRAMPDGQFSWKINRSTIRDGDERYPDFKSAESGEMAMKKFLRKNAKHLGGEFYLATEDAVFRAWMIGRKAALCSGS